MEAINHVATTTQLLEDALGFQGCWQDRIISQYKAVTWETWDEKRVYPSRTSGEPMAIKLPWSTLLLMVPGFLSQAEIYRLQQKALPGGVQYQQPLRQVRNPDGSFSQFNEHHKEAWLCNDYDYRDSRRVAQPRVHAGQPVEPWAGDLLDRASRAALAPFNGLMCRWEPPGIHVKDGPHTYSTHHGWGEETVIGLLAVGPTRAYRIHGIPWFYGRGWKEVVALNIPLEEGTLVVLGGPLKERWLYGQPRDETMMPERIQFTLQLHADPELAKGNLDKATDFTEDGEDGDYGQSTSHPVASVPIETYRSSTSASRTAHESEANATPALDEDLGVAGGIVRTRWNRSVRKQDLPLMCKRLWTAIMRTIMWIHGSGSCLR